MIRARPPLLVLVFLASAPAFGQMHLCTDAQGRKTFSDVPCGPDAKPVTVSPSGGSTAVNPATAISTEHYDIRGTSWSELRGQIDSLGPKGWAGMASSRIGYQVTPKPEGTGCVVGSAQARAETKVQLPQWRNRFDGPRPLQVYWDSVYRSLDLHERGHVNINLEGARDLERRLREIPRMATCAEVLAEARRRAQDLWEAVGRRQREYDAETDHGRRQWSPYRD